MGKWHLSSTGYAVKRIRTSIGRKTVRMHRVVIGKVPKGMEVDHINRNKLDNRRTNLRVVPHNENCKNGCGRPKQVYPGLPKGITYDKSRGKFLTRNPTKRHNTIKEALLYGGH